MGHLHSHVTLFPDPNLSLFQQQFANEGTQHDTLTPSNTAHSSSPFILTTGTPMYFPTSLSIIGFVATKKMTSPPSLSYHMIIPTLPLLSRTDSIDSAPSTVPELGPPTIVSITGGNQPNTAPQPNQPTQQQTQHVQLQAIVKTETATTAPSPAGSTTATSATTLPAPTNEENNALFCVTLANCLKNEKISAIVTLAKGWYGLVNFITNDDASIGGIYSISLSISPLPPPLTLPPPRVEHLCSPTTTATPRLHNMDIRRSARASRVSS